MRTPGGACLVSVSCEAVDSLTYRTTPDVQEERPYVRRRIAELFDVQCDVTAVGAALATLRGSPGMRALGCVDRFEMCVRAVLGQQVSVQFASRLASRIVQRFGAELETESKCWRVFPTPETIARSAVSSVAELGVISSRALAIIHIAELFANGTLAEEPPFHYERIEQTLLGIPGVGPWTAQYMLMRAWHFKDAFPASDLGVRKALGMASPKECGRIAEAWRPYRSYAVFRLWNSLELG